MASRDFVDIFFGSPSTVSGRNSYLPKNWGGHDLSPAQRSMVSNFEQGESGKRKRFAGKPGETCRNPKCNTILRESNLYSYCSPCIERRLRRNSGKNLTAILESMRRDRTPRKQARRG